MDAEDSWIITVQNYTLGGGYRNLFQKTRCRVYLAKSIQLITHDVEQQRIFWLHLLHKFNSPGFV